MSLERLLLIAGALAIPSISGLLWAVYTWGETGFGLLQYNKLLRVMIIALTGLSCALEIGFSAFLLGIMETPRRTVEI